MKNNTPHTSKSGGSAMVAVIIATTLIGIIVASLMKGAVTEMKVNDHHVTLLKAKVGAESAIEYGAADLASRFNRQSSVSADELRPGKNPLSIPKTATSLFTDSGIVAEKLSVQGGVVPPGSWLYIDPDDPANDFDPMAGKRVFSRDIEVFGTGTAVTGSGKQITAYAMESFQVRDAPLFANAIFYNGDLEINPGVDMNIYGPVHTNSDLWVGAKSSADLVFHDKVTAEGDIRHDEKRPVHIGDGSNVQFPAGGGNYRGMKVSGSSGGLLGGLLGGSNNNILDSVVTGVETGDLVSAMSERWNGYLQDGQMGVKEQAVSGFDDYQADDFSTPGNEAENHGYAIIEPLLPHNHPDRKNATVRSQKMAYKAGMILKVGYDTSKSPSSSEYIKVNAYRYERENSSDPLSAPVMDSNGDPKLVAVTLPSGIIGDPDGNFKEVTSDHPEAYYQSGSKVYGGLYDHRENKAIDTLALDVGELKSYIDSKDNGSSGFNGTYDVDKHWNGVVYVEFPTSTSEDGSGNFDYGTSTGQNSYNVVPAVSDDLALMVIDAREIPEPSGAKQPGFSVATNGVMYTVGSFNADGSAHNKDAQKPDNSSEKPASLMADTVNILSDNWKYNRKYSKYDGRSYVQNYRPANSFVEISAAIVSGTPNTVPSGSPYGDSSRPLSLGVVNLPRFLESWSGDTLTIRGSLVSLYESELRPLGAPSNFNNFYLPPTRDWGFHDLFAQGQFPPGTPVVRTYRRLFYEELNQADYESAIANISY